MTIGVRGARNVAADGTLRVITRVLACVALVVVGWTASEHDLISLPFLFIDRLFRVLSEDVHISRSLTATTLGWPPDAWHDACNNCVETS